MTRAQKWTLAVGTVATALSAIALLFSKAMAVRYYANELRSVPQSELLSYLQAHASSVRAQAMTEFAATPTGRQRLVSTVVQALDRAMNSRSPSLGRPQAPTSESFARLDHFLCGMRWNERKQRWDLWVDARWPGVRHRGSCVAPPPCETNGTALMQALDIACRSQPTGAPLTIPEYPDVAFTLTSFEQGFRACQAVLRTGGESLEETSYWYEVLDEWPTLLKEGMLLPWLIQAQRVGQSSN